MTSTLSSASSASPPPLTSCGDSVDIDAFINFDSTLYPSPSLSPSNSRGKTAITQQPALASSSNSYASTPSQPQTFSGPSHQYEQYKQQTGLPVGGLANTLAINQNMGYGGMNSGFVMPSDPFFNLGLPDDMYNFNAMDGRNLSIGDGSNLDLEMDSPSTETLHPYLYPSGKAEFIDPNAVGGQEEPAAPPSNVGRMWPGMHQQQAAMAKAAQQQKQQEVIRQQRQLEAQSAPPQARPNRAAAHRPNDPIVEERISRLLHQMRQNSAGSPDDDASTPPGNAPLVKLKREEEDMDEDERLLASEEGKKLSSKERRQLRNKVSARAFRSRRKEYISQLEGEVAKHAAENSDLKTQNQALMEENARLTDLTRMLLSSSAFTGFMNELVVNDSLPRPAQERPAPQPSLQPNTRKDVNPHQAQQGQLTQNRQQINMALMPDIDFSNLDLNGNWNSGIDMGFTGNTQVFAVTEVPQGPAVDTSILSGKASNSVPSFSSDDSKDQVPVVERMPVIEKVEETVATCDDVELDESDPAFALFIDLPVPQATAAKSEPEPFEDMFGGVTPEKVFSRLELVLDNELLDQDTLAMERFEHLCSSIEAAYQRVGNMTSHL